jgi:hypothetical protein
MVAPISITLPRPVLKAVFICILVGKAVPSWSLDAIRERRLDCFAGLKSAKDGD